MNSADFSMWGVVGASLSFPKSHDLTCKMSIFIIISSCIIRPNSHCEATCFVVSSRELMEESEELQATQLESGEMGEMRRKSKAVLTHASNKIKTSGMMGCMFINFCQHIMMSPQVTK